MRRRKVESSKPSSMDSDRPVIIYYCKSLIMKVQVKMQRVVGFDNLVFDKKEDIVLLAYSIIHFL